MDRLSRIPLLAGGLAGVLWLVGVLVLEAAGNPADPADGSVIAEFYRDDRATILFASVLHALGGLLFLVFVAALWPLATAGGAPHWLATAVVVGGVAGGTMMLAMMGGQSTGATTDEALLTPDTAVVFWRLAHGFFVGAEIALALFVGALSGLALRGFVLPRWLGWFGLVLAILLVLLPIGWAALIFLLPVWLVLASIVLWRRTRVTTAPAP